jgi:hypothetical protein
MVKVAIGRESGGGGEQENEREVVSHIQQLGFLKHYIFGNDVKY